MMASEPKTDQPVDYAKQRAILEIKRARLAWDAMDEHLRRAEQALGL